MNLLNLTYFNAIIGVAYFSEIIGFGISNGIGIYVNQNFKNKNKVDYYVKIGGYINCLFSLVFVIILACCYYPILHLLLGLPKDIDYTFYFLAPFLINNIYLIYFIVLVPVLMQTILGLIVFKRKTWMGKISLEEEVKVVVFDFDDTLYSGVNWLNWELYCKEAVSVLFKSLDLKKYKKVHKSVEKKEFSDEEIVKQLIKYNLDIQTWIEYRENNKCEIDYSNCNVVDNKILKMLAEKYHLYIVSNSTLKEIYEISNNLNIDLSLFKGIFENKFDNNNISKKDYIIIS